MISQVLNLSHGSRINEDSFDMKNVITTSIKFCFIGFAAVLLVGSSETIKIAVKKSDEFIYKNVDKVARKDEVTGRREFNLTSVEDELRLGRQAFDQIVAQYEGKVLPKNDARYVRIEAIFRRVIAASHFRDTNTSELAVIDDPRWNAYATTGGRTIFFTGLVDSDTNDEIAEVVGHELAHSSLSHITESQWRSRLKVAVNSKGVQTGFTESLSVVDERESDEIGLLYSTLAGYDPIAVAKIWAKKAQEQDSVYHYFSTHLANHERAKANAVTASKPVNILLLGR
ncbi:M48 family metalloprotease [Litorivicinus sp.]|nr:M48 family metalloprotease [Litorivicinus sp.]